MRPITPPALTTENSPEIDWRNRVCIDRAALRSNVAQVRARCQSRILAMVKADAYGHGLAQVLPTLVDFVDGFGVARLREGMRCREILRATGVGDDKRVVVLSDFTAAAQLPHYAAHALDLTVHAPAQLTWMQHYAGKKINVWLKIDSGMNRLGLPPADAAPAHAMLAAHASVGEVVLMSHLANADDVGGAQTQKQIKVFAEAQVGAPASLANSAGVCAWPQTHYDWVRPGLMLYGGSPLPNQTAASLDLRAAMTFEAKLFACKTIGANQPVGYGGAFTTQRETKLGFVAAGYAEGYPRSLSSEAVAQINGQSAPVIGNVSMNIITLDLTDIEAARPGDVVQLWGDAPEVSQVARTAQSVAQDLLSNIGADVPRVVK